MNLDTGLAGFNEFGFNESSRFNVKVLTSKRFFHLIKNLDLTNIRVQRIIGLVPSDSLNPATTV